VIVTASKLATPSASTVAVLALTGRLLAARISSVTSSPAKREVRTRTSVWMPGAAASTSTVTCEVWIATNTSDGQTDSSPQATSAKNAATAPSRLT
jgi:hypothetical protein